MAITGLGLLSATLLLLLLHIGGGESAGTTIKLPRIARHLQTRKTVPQPIKAPGQGSVAGGGNNGSFWVANYEQTLDHFSYRPEGYATFQQRYAVDPSNWGGPGSPIFFLLGAEGAALDTSFQFGPLTTLAKRFKALLVGVEHRYYGSSVPFGSAEESHSNATTLGYLNSAQALADYAQFITDLKKDLKAEGCPVIAVGASYGGMLAAWFRLKYPDIVIGALASSAPILFFDDLTPADGYDRVVEKDFKDTSVSCHQTIVDSWPAMDKVASQPGGLARLSQQFKTCWPLGSVQQLRIYLEGIYQNSAQYDKPYNLVSQICNAIGGGGGNAAADSDVNFDGWYWQRDGDADRRGERRQHAARPAFQSGGVHAVLPELLRHPPQASLDYYRIWWSSWYSRGSQATLYSQMASGILIVSEECCTTYRRASWR